VEGPVGEDVRPEHVVLRLGFEDELEFLDHDKLGVWGEGRLTGTCLQVVRGDYSP